jgi:hypothetical protein
MTLIGNNMRSYEQMDYHPIANQLVDVLCQKTQSTNRLFFHVMVAYYLTKIASMMRTTVNTHDRGKIPVNCYAINLAYSGEGKGHSTNIVEENVINCFKDRFMEETFPGISQASLAKLAIKRAIKKNVPEDEELLRVEKEFDLLGNLAFSFDSGTTAAVKQMRQKLLMSGCGSMNMEIDEIGSNLLGNVDVLNTFLELFDVGKVKQKLTKNTAENLRNEEIDGKTPTNMMLFGTPAKLLNGGAIEDALMTFLDTGYARRCLFGYAKISTKDTSLTPTEIYDMLTDPGANTFLQTLSNDLGGLAHPSYFETVIDIDKDVSLLLIKYKLQCEKIANSLSDHEEIRKAEVAHRYFKTLKLAGTYAFIDRSTQLTEDHLYNAIKIVEDSGKAFEALLTRERNYAKLANYIANIGREVTHVDMVEDLPFYKGGENQKRELMTLAIAYGYRNNIIIKQSVTDGIEFLTGESLTQTDLQKMTISYSTQLAENYSCEFVPFDKLHELTQLPNYHWVAHHLLDNYRREENVVPGFNIVVLDIDDGVSIDTAELLMKEYKYLLYTTKRHTDINNRFRIILPMTHTLKLDPNEYKEFMANVFEWLPFDVDKQTNQRARKWLTFNGKHSYNDGKLLDSLLFIPKTSKNEERKRVISDQQSLNNVERWFMTNTVSGNRSNQLIRYAYMLVDSGMDINGVQNAILALNNKLPDKMPEAEILSTILVTAAKAIAKRNAAP